MIYLLVGDNKIFKDFKYNDIKAKLIDCESKTFHIETQKDLKLLEDDIELFLITKSFFYNKKIIKLNCYEDIDIYNTIKKFITIVNEDSILVIYINKIDSKIKKNFSNFDNIEIINFDNIYKKDEANIFTKNLLINSNLKFKTNKDMNLVLESILLEAKKKDAKIVYDKSLIYLEVQKLISLCNNKSKIEYKDIEQLYKKSFNGNFFELIDQIFCKKNIYEIIEIFEDKIELFNIDEIKTLINILLYTFKDYLKYENKIKTNKYFVFKKSKLKINQIDNFIINLNELYLNIKITNKFNKEELYFLFLKFVHF